MAVDAVRHSFGDLADAVADLDRLDAKHCRTIVNMHPARGRDILIRMAAGESFASASRNYRGVYDTRGWDEVLNRLRWSRGSVMNAARIVGNGATSTNDEATRKRLVRYARQLITEAKRLDKILVASVIRPSGQAKSHATNPPRDCIPKKPKAKSPFQLLGKAISNVAKNARDIPRMGEHRVLPADPRPTKEELDASRREVRAIIQAGRDLLVVCGGRQATP